MDRPVAQPFVTWQGISDRVRYPVRDGASAIGRVFDRPRATQSRQNRIQRDLIDLVITRESLV